MVLETQDAIRSDGVFRYVCDCLVCAFRHALTGGLVLLGTERGTMGPEGGVKDEVEVASEREKQVV